MNNTAARPRTYVVQVGQFAWQSVARLVRAPSHSRRAEARRALARRWLGIAALTAIVVGFLMFLVDVATVEQMPPRGTASLWWLRIFTELGKSTYVLWALGGLLIILLLILPLLRDASRSILIAFGTRIQYLFFSVLFAVLCGEVLKYIIGRSRPFVGGDANAFYYQHFAGNPAFESLPSGHATTAFALAFAVSAVWRRMTLLMFAYAVLICISRVVLLAHHPSDVVAGALNGVICALVVQYWFAARRLGFKIVSGGAIETLAGPSWTSLKRVARGAFAP